MAGLAALMTRKKRDRRRELEQLKEKLNDPVAMAELTGKEAEEMMKAKNAQETIKKMLNGKELLNQKKSFDAVSQVSHSAEKDEDEDGEGKGGAGKMYNGIYLGLIVISIGVVITFVGLGEKGFKTLELKLIGPIIILVGLTMITVKTLQCTFPHVFGRNSAFGDKEKTSLMEKGEGMEDTQSSNSSLKQKKTDSNNASMKRKIKKKVKDKEVPEGEPEVVTSPKVILESSKSKDKVSSRPRSTIPNYIEASSDDDESNFNPQVGRRKHQEWNDDALSPFTPQEDNFNSSRTSHHHHHFVKNSNDDIYYASPNGGSPPNSRPPPPPYPDHHSEIILTPRGLKL